MDRPKHRWLIISGALAGCALLLLAHQWISTDAPDDTLPGVTSAVSRRPHAEQIEPRIEAVTPVATPAVAATPSESGKFRGRVIDAVTRQPVNEFELRMKRIQRGAWRGEPPSTRSFQSPLGRFSWDNAPAGVWDVTVAARGYQPFQLPELNITSGKPVQGLILPLIRGHRVTGRVFDTISGAGLGGANVIVRDPSSPMRPPDSERYEKTKEDGSFVLEGVPSGNVRLTAAALGHASRDVAIVVDEHTAAVEIGLSAGGTVAGLLVVDGQPIAGRVFLAGAGAMGTPHDVDETGVFTYRHRRPGRYVISATTAAGKTSQELEVDEGGRVDLILSVAGGGRSVRGTITGLRPDQFAQTIVTLQSEENAGYFTARVDEHGGYRLTSVPPGRARVTVYAPRMSRQLTKRVEVPRAQDLVFDIAFPPGARLTGRVTQGGEPVAERTIWMTPAGDVDRSYRSHSQQDGRYEIEGLLPGDYRLRAEEDVGRTITIAGDTTLDIDIPSVQLAGRVIDDGSGAPIVGAIVFLRGTEPATAGVEVQKETDHFGRFKTTGLEQGEIAFTVHKPGYEMRRERLTYAAPMPNTTIRLRRSDGVEVRVQQVAGDMPLRGLTVREKIGDEWTFEFWVPLDGAGIGSLPRTLIGSTLSITGSSRRVVINGWDGQPLDVTL